MYDALEIVASVVVVVEVVMVVVFLPRSLGTVSTMSFILGESKKENKRE